MENLKPKGRIKIFNAYINKKLICAVTLLKKKKKILGEFLMSHPKYNFLSPKIILTYEAIKWGHQNGFQSFDLGRTRFNSGVYLHKKKWGGHSEKILYSFFFLKKKSNVLLYP